MKLDSLSASRLNCFYRCGMTFYFRYVMGEKRRPSSALMVGSQFHESVGFNFQQKVESHEDLKTSDVLEHFAANYDVASKGVLWQPGEDVGKIKDTGVAILDKFHHVVSPEIQPVYVEKEFTITTDEYDFPLNGWIDCVSDADEILEIKTKGSKPRQPDFSHKVQASLYALAFRMAGVRETHVRMDYAIKTKTPQIKTFIYQVQYADLVLLTNMIRKMVKTVEQEVWLPNRGINTCNRRWCGFWDMCEKECGGRVPD